ncbi:hypothetical protein [Vibrio phage vB_ValS_PJ32]|nr:hypothetical protein [Vibrio phage vB_ValS_PJ32]
MAQNTVTIQTTCPTPSIYDLSRMMLCDRTIILDQMPLIYQANVNALHLPSCTNKQILIPTEDPAGKFILDLGVVNKDAFFRNFKGLVMTGYASAPNLDLLLDFVDSWRELSETKTTLAEINLASIQALQLVFGLDLGEVVTDHYLTGRNESDAVSYARELTAHFMGERFVYRSGHTSINEMLIVSEALICGESMRYQVVDQNMPGLDRLPCSVDIKNTSCLEALAWLSVDDYAEFFKATLYGN